MLKGLFTLVNYEIKKTNNREATPNGFIAFVSKYPGRKFLVPIELLNLNCKVEEGKEIDIGEFSFNDIEEFVLPLLKFGEKSGIGQRWMFIEKLFKYCPYGKPEIYRFSKLCPTYIILEQLNYKYLDEVFKIMDGYYRAIPYELHTCSINGECEGLFTRLYPKYNLVKPLKDGK